MTFTAKCDAEVLKVGRLHLATSVAARAKTLQSGQVESLSAATEIQLKQRFNYTGSLSMEQFTFTPGVSNQEVRHEA
jgi:hypothetical protein